MDNLHQNWVADPGAACAFALRFTPAEWRHLLQDAAFLRDSDNSYLPRRLMGVPVQIVRDHRAQA